MTRVTPSMRAEFERRRRNNESYFSIAADFNVCGATVAYQTPHIRAHAPMGMPRTFDYERAAELSKVMAPREIAERLGVSKPSVLRALRVMRRGYP